MNATRRDVVKGGGNAVLVAAMAMTAAVVTPPAKASQPDRLRKGVQALVNEIRRGLNGNITTASFSALQEVADRLEALPDIQPIPNEIWERWRSYAARFSHISGWRALRPPSTGRAI